MTFVTMSSALFDEALAKSPPAHSPISTSGLVGRALKIGRLRSSIL
jgi:hypothetical protein